MSRRVYISLRSNAELRPMHVFESELPGLVPARSIWQVVGYVVAVQGGKPLVAQEILSKPPELTDNILRSNDLGLTAPEVFATMDILTAVVCDQLSYESSPFRVAFLASLLWDDLWHAPEFILCNSGVDRVLGCGVAEHQAKRLISSEFSGANVYGNLVLDKALALLRDGPKAAPKVWKMPALTQAGGVSFDVGDGRDKTVLFISDSMGKSISEIDGGSAFWKSGGLFTHLIAFLNEIPVVELQRYRGCVIFCGVNVLQLPVRKRVPEKARENQCDWFVDRVAKLRDECPKLEIRIGLVIPHESLTNLDISVEHFNLRLKNRLEAIEGVTCVDFSASPFCVGGRRVTGLFSQDGFHLNSEGTRFLWRQLTKGSQFERVRMTVGNRPEGFPSMEFEEMAQEGLDAVLVVDMNNNDERVVLNHGTGSAETSDAESEPETSAFMDESVPEACEPTESNFADYEPDMELLEG